MTYPDIDAKIRPDRILVIRDSALSSEHCVNLVTEISKHHADCTVGTLVIEGGEGVKSLQHLEMIWRQLLSSHMSRSSWVFAVGGGTLTDLVGLAASTFKRGVNWVAVPTTLLGMVDAAWGGKTGINWGGIKNVLGTFHPPLVVWNEAQWLETLPEIEIWNGWMEMVKHSLIDSGEAWSNLASQDHPTKLSASALHGLAVSSARIKQDIVAQDPHETGRRKVLNFGHTLAHALEALSHEASGERPLPHGMAVGWGMCFSLELSSHRLRERSPELDEAGKQIRCWLEQTGFGEQPKFSPDLIWEKMQQDKKNRQGEVLDVLLNSMGHPRWDVVVDRADFVRIWDRLH